MTKPRVLLVFGSQGFYAHAASEGVEVVSVDQSSSLDRVYVSEGELTDAEFDALQARAINGENPHADDKGGMQ